MSVLSAGNLRRIGTQRRLVTGIVITLIVTTPAEDPPLMDGVQCVDDDIDPGDR